MSYAEAYSLAVTTINEAIHSTMADVRYEDLFAVEKDAQGRVSMLNANTMRMNELATRTALAAQKELDAAENSAVQIPLGAALGIRFLAGAGPRVTVKVVPVGAVGTEFITEFESAGINQTRHKISMSFHTTVRLVIPTGAQRVEVSSTAPIAENIIVGLVPDSYVDVANQDDMLNLIP